MSISKGAWRTAGQRQPVQSVQHGGCPGAVVHGGVPGVMGGGGTVRTIVVPCGTPPGRAITGSTVALQWALQWATVGLQWALQWVTLKMAKNTVFHVFHEKVVKLSDFHQKVVKLSDFHQKVVKKCTLVDQKVHEVHPCRSKSGSNPYGTKKFVLNLRY